MNAVKSIKKNLELNINTYSDSELDSKPMSSVFVSKEKSIESDHTKTASEVLDSKKITYRQKFISLSKNKVAYIKDDKKTQKTHITNKTHKTNQTTRKDEFTDSDEETKNNIKVKKKDYDSEHYKNKSDYLDSPPLNYESAFYIQKAQEVKEEKLKNIEVINEQINEETTLGKDININVLVDSSEEENEKAATVINDTNYLSDEFKKDLNNQPKPKNNNIEFGGFSTIKKNKDDVNVNQVTTKKILNEIKEKNENNLDNFDKIVETKNEINFSKTSSNNKYLTYENSNKKDLNNLKIEGNDLIQNNVNEIIDIYYASIMDQKSEQNIVDKKPIIIENKIIDIKPDTIEKNSIKQLSIQKINTISINEVPSDNEKEIEIDEKRPNLETQLFESKKNDKNVTKIQKKNKDKKDKNVHVEVVKKEIISKDKIQFIEKIKNGKKKSSKPQSENFEEDRLELQDSKSKKKNEKLIKKESVEKDKKLTQKYTQLHKDKPITKNKKDKTKKALDQNFKLINNPLSKYYSNKYKYWKENVKLDPKYPLKEYKNIIMEDDDLIIRDYKNIYYNEIEQGPKKKLKLSNKTVTTLFDEILNDLDTEVEFLQPSYSYIANSISEDLIFINTFFEKDDFTYNLQGMCKTPLFKSEKTIFLKILKSDKLYRVQINEEIYDDENDWTVFKLNIGDEFDISNYSSNNLKMHFYLENEKRKKIIK